LKTEIFIVSVAKHFDWLEYCLRSIQKFASGFSGVTLLVPSDDHQKAIGVANCYNSQVPLSVLHGPEWPGKGMLWHMAQKMRADEWCKGADFVLHIDSDCMFTEPVTPEDYFVDGKPVLMHASFEWLVKAQQANLSMWKEAAERALGWEVTQETMRRHPAVHHHSLYVTARQCIEAHTGMKCDDYIQSCENQFPQTFAEFPTLGAVALKVFPDFYAWRNQETQGFPPSKLVQFWSHSPPHVPQAPVYKDKPFPCTPDYFLK
jgi:hypothetical protein